MKKHWNGIIKKSAKGFATASLMTAAVATMAVSFTGCGQANKPAEATEVQSTGTEQAAENASSADTHKEWAVYWYLCGSDLESRFGSASADIEELLSVKMPANVEFVVETGGSYEWKREDISAEKLQRFVYNSDGWRMEEELEDANMGESSTLSDFLQYCGEKHDADHKMLILWNHGGGTLGGIAYDENYGMDSLSMPELKTALQDAGQQFDIIGFDACLMSNIDTICTVGEYADYMIASEEQEPGNGWEYSAFAEILSKAGADTAAAGTNTAEAGAAKSTAESIVEVGKQICDAFYAGCEKFESEKSATLALIDLSKMAQLEESFGKCGDELFKASLADDASATAIIRGAKNAENYGANSKEEGFTNMVDITNLVQKVLAQDPDEETQGELQELMELVDDAVLYQVRGDFRTEGAGISCYYPLDDSLRSLLQFKSVQGTTALQNLYQYLLTGKLNEELLKYIESSGINEEDVLTSHITVESMGLEGVYLNKDENDLILNLGPESSKYVTMVQSYIGVLNEETMKIYSFGNLRCDVENWETGEFRLAMPTEWWSIDGHYVYTFLSTATDKYSIYTIPVVLNGVEKFIRVAHDYEKDTMTIVAVSEANNDTYIADRMQNPLQDGDIITTRISYLDQISGDGDSLYEYETFEYNKDMKFERIPMPNGIACGIFALFDAWGNHAYSKPIIFDIEDGEAW